ncbi:unnamed protein product [Aphanomyces euteiches]
MVNHLGKLFCVLLLVLGMSMLASTVVAQFDGSDSGSGSGSGPSPPTTTSRKKTPTVTTSTPEPTTTSKRTTAKPTTAAPTPEATPAPTTTDAPTTTATPSTTATPEPTTSSTTTTTTPSTTATTKKVTTTIKPSTTVAATPEPTTEEVTTTAAPKTADTSSGSSNTGLYIGLGVGGAVLLFAIVFLVLRLGRSNDDDDDDDDDQYKVTAPTYNKSIPPVSVLSADSQPVKPAVKPPVQPTYNPYASVAVPAPAPAPIQHQNPPPSSLPNGSFFNTTSTTRDSDFEFEPAHNNVPMMQQHGGYDTDRESEFASESFIQNPNGHHPVYEFKDSIDSRDSSMTSEDHFSPKNRKNRVSSVEL